MAGTDAAKQREVLEAAFQMELKLPYPGGSQLGGTRWRLTFLMVSARR